MVESEGGRERESERASAPVVIGELSGPCTGPTLGEISGQTPPPPTGARADWTRDRGAPWRRAPLYAPNKERKKERRKQKERKCTSSWGRGPKGRATPLPREQGGAGRAQGLQVVGPSGKL